MYGSLCVAGWKQMEIAGEICQVCARPVLSESEAAACRHCQTRFHQSCLASMDQLCAVCGRVWDADPEPLPDSDAASPLRFLEGELQRPKTPLPYHFSLVAVSLGMILLVILYLGMIALFAYGVIYYAVHFAPIVLLEKLGFVGIIFVLLVYLIPLFAGLILVFFLVKPLFARANVEGETFSLNHADAPQLFTLVGWICRSLEAPIPSRIDVDCALNAGAGFRNGWRSLFGNDIILVIGLPLVAGMNLNQFAGILAHEYGHFSQGSAMRATYLIRQINSWFYRLVYGRDQWDISLAMASEEEHQGLLALGALYSARLAIALTRGVLWVLMICGQVLSSFMSRQMEFDADRYQFRMCGSASFAKVMRRLRQLNLGFNAATVQIKNKWKKERKLIDRLPEYIVSQANEITADAQGKFHASLAEKHTRLFDLHPSDAERVERAVTAREPGIFHSTGPATELFADFAGLSRRLTLNYYQGVLGPRFRAESLISTEQVNARNAHDFAADRAVVSRYFLGVATESRPVFVMENKTVVVRQGETLKRDIQSARREMEALLPAAQNAFAEFTFAKTRLLHARIAALLLDAGFHFEPADFHLMDADVDAAQMEAHDTIQGVEADLQSFEAAARSHLTNTIQLLRMPEMNRLLPHVAKLRDDAREMIWVLERLENIFCPLLELRDDCAALECLLRYRQDQPAAENVAGVIENLCAGIQEGVNRIQTQTALIRYPFHHALEQIMVSEYARNKDYHADRVELTLAEGQSYAEKLLDLYWRLLATLISIGREVEQTLGDPK